MTSLTGFTCLDQLEDLNLSENLINTMEGIEKCPKLKKLNLSNNKFEQFENIPDLPALEELNLSLCPISKLDSLGNFIKFKSLKNLNLSETPIAEEKGDDLKKEVLIMLDGLKMTTFNGEEVTEEDL